MNTTLTEPATDIITELQNRIAADVKPIDRESRFDDMLEESYSFGKVGGPFANMSPSSVLKEVDPTAYRCGVNDFADGESWVEVDGETYDQDECEEIKTALVDELEIEETELETELEEAKEEEEPDQSEVFRIEKELAAVQDKLRILNKHSF